MIPLDFLIYFSLIPPDTLLDENKQKTQTLMECVQSTWFDSCRAAITCFWRLAIQWTKPNTPTMIKKKTGKKKKFINTSCIVASLCLTQSEKRTGKGEAKMNLKKKK